MTQKIEKKFDKYKKRGNANWVEMMSKDPRKANAYQQARYDWILRVAGDVAGKKVLDVGCGGGSLVYLLAKAGAEVTGIEYEELGYGYAQKNLGSVKDGKSLTYTLLRGSAYELPFKNESFDIVVSCEVIEHLQEPERMLSESARVLKKGGKCIITTPYRLTGSPRDPNHVREYYPEELKEMVSAYFQDTRVRETHHMLWRALYTYGFKIFGGRPLGKWFINTGMILFGVNPFLKEYERPGKFELFSSILTRSIK